MNDAPKSTLVTRLLAPFLTGVLFLSPLILTFLLLGWLGGYVAAAFGPESFMGRAIAGGGRIFTGADADEALAFWIGVALVLAAITAIGVVVQTKAKDALEGAVDGLLGRIPVLGGLYKPVAQFVRMMGGDGKGELKGMSPVSVRFGDTTEVLALLATPQIYDLGQGPRHLILIPTAPVPVGGALLFVAVDAVRPVPGMKVEDLAKLYVTMGTVMPEGLSQR
ncbi:DUF502 domain-containing protein [Sandaracinobacteroides saxicola]|uniref:DUF502 domain-containing protein n=1 Tax=Sandaracinobacteroides saxicola TaxID=2759707 RepID=A0A7G5IL22_9SPHN|nr:DUF502 domain-containing protein [Sandaracinobacteroides saxicola]QMW24064.1 DUF502 domain-containing protein [Sandaracinobacteroides saxicola]